MFSTSRIAANSARSCACSSAVIGRLLSGVHQLAVRWYTVSDAASSATTGMICTPLEPVPMTATRLPAKSTGVAGQRPVWCCSPPKSSRPATSGKNGTDRTPVAATRNRARTLAAVPERHGPECGGRVERRGGDRGAEAHVAAEVEAVDDVVQVALGLGLLGEVLLPLPLVEELLREQVAVGVALRVEAGAGVAVPVPGAADAAAGLDQRHREARLARAVQLVDAGDPGADDEDVDVGGRRRRRVGSMSDGSMGLLAPERIVPTG